MTNVSYKIFIFLSAIFLLGACQKEDHQFGDIVAPSNLKVTYEVVGQSADLPNGDGSGLVHFNASADNAITYKFTYDGDSKVAPSGGTSYNFGNTGTQKYTVTVEAIGTAGVSTSKSVEVEVLVLYAPPADLLDMLVGDESRTWRVKAEAPGHFGVGPAEETSPIWYAAGAFDKKVTGMYDDRYIFHKDGTFTHVTNGTVFGKADPLNATFGDQGLTPNGNNEHENYALEEYSGKWNLSAPGGQETMALGSNGFFGFYVGASTYSILSRSANEMMIKCIGADGLSWFFVLTNKEPDSKKVDVVYTNLVWSDDFDTEIDSSKWTYDIGLGTDGWGNNESQVYTSRTDNAYTSDGTLKIVAKKESYEGSDYTSARLKTQGLFDFQYGRVDVRAKLPKGGGTWPAIWMLGANFNEVGWPACGEIDIMEHVGNEIGKVSGSIHTPSSFGATTNTGSIDIADATDEFHIYSINWSKDEISFLVDDEIYYTYNPDPKNGDTWPFDASQFLILNLAMGGDLGGAIADDFSEATFEIDFVKVYQ